jgi:DNA-binding winged helix-turn-helix (wHTH) protein
MSLALDVDHARLTASTPTLRLAPAIPPATESNTHRHIRAVPDGTEARGFVLYVGIDEAKAADAGTSLGSLVEALKVLTARVAPAAETYATVALAPSGAGGRDVDVVRLALREPSAVAEHRAPAPETKSGVVIDITRARVTIDDRPAALTYKEFGLLRFLVQHEGRTTTRSELIRALWSAGDTERPSERTIDVHVRRLRAKLGRYEQIVRTVRGFGYRYDRHADVSVQQSAHSVR